MKKLKANVLTYNGLAILFATLGSILLLFATLFPESALQSFGESIFPYTQPWAAEFFLNVFQSLGIELYGGAILSFAFGIVDDRQSALTQQTEQTNHDELVSQIKMLANKVEELSSQVETFTQTQSIQNRTRPFSWLRGLFTM